jgi:hypothetical protein
VTLVFNLAGAISLGLGIAAWIAAQVVGHDELRLIAGFGTLALIATALELQPKEAWRPRYFWIVPGWLAGALGLGTALLETHATAGYAVLAAAGLALAGVLARDMARKPGARWLAGLLLAGAVVAAWQLAGYARPGWQHPALYAINAVAMLACLVCSVQLYRARKTSDDTSLGTG